MCDSILIVNRTQFGYHIDTLYYARYIAKYRPVTYLCWDYGQARQQCEGVRVKYISRAGPMPIRYARFLWYTLAEARSPHALGFFTYFPGCSLLKFFGTVSHWVFDVRTGPLYSSSFAKQLYNLLVRTEAAYFANIAVISQSLAELMGFDLRNVHILPLGADPVATNDKSFRGDLNLLYVGTLHLRKIDLTIRGLADFIASAPEHSVNRYTIIGSGFHGEEQYLRKLSEELGIQNIVEITGMIPHSELRPYFESHNVGVAFVPIIRHFDCQPATKVFEYMTSGLVTLATETTENARVIDDTNGILIQDSAEGFAFGLQQLHERRNSFSNSEIRRSGSCYTWNEVINKNLLPYLKGILNDHSDSYHNA